MPKRFCHWRRAIGSRAETRALPQNWHTGRSFVLQPDNSASRRRPPCNSGQLHWPPKSLTTRQPEIKHIELEDFSFECPPVTRKGPSTLDRPVTSKVSVTGSVGHNPLASIDLDFLFCGNILARFTSYVEIHMLRTHSHSSTLPDGQSHYSCTGENQQS